MWGFFLTFFHLQWGGGEECGWRKGGKSNSTTTVWVYTQFFTKLGPSQNGLENNIGFWFSEFTCYIF